MGKNKKWLQAVILTAIVIIGAFTIWSNLNAGDAKGAKKGGKAPEFTLVGLDGTSHKLSDFQGKPVMVNFWATWCPPCEREMPAIQEQYLKRNKDVVILAVNMGESKVSVQAFQAKYGLSFPILLDKSEEVRKNYGVMNYPTTFFIKPDGKIYEVMVGEMDKAYLDKTFTAMLGR